MSDNAQLHELPEDGGSSSALADLPSRQALNAHNAYCPISPRPPSQRPKNRRKNSGASHVDVDFFDPSGVRQLNRTLSRMSSNQGDVESASTYSDATLTTSGPFDFERTIRVVMKKCVPFLSTHKKEANNLSDATRLTLNSDTSGFSSRICASSDWGLPRRTSLLWGQC